MSRGARWSELDLIQYDLNKSSKEDGSFKLKNQIRGGNKPAKNANAFTAQIIGFLQGRGFEVSRTNTVGIFDQDIALGKIYSVFLSWKSGNLKGIAAIKGAIKSCLKGSYRKSHEKRGKFDISGYHKEKGTHIEVEVKVGKDKLSIHQELRLKKLNESGAIGIVASKLNDVILPVLKWEEENLNK